MNFDMLLTNILSPPVLFFFLGVIAVLVKSDLKMPEPLPPLVISSLHQVKFA